MVEKIEGIMSVSIRLAILRLVGDEVGLYVSVLFFGSSSNITFNHFLDQEQWLLACAFCSSRNEYRYRLILHVEDPLPSVSPVTNSR
jgi:hypothetical protein